MLADVKIDQSWKKPLEAEFGKSYFKQLLDFLEQEKMAGKIIFPPAPQIFAAFEHTPFDQVKVVIIGQDPYHGQGQAHGLCFSVNKGINVPPSLKNIYKELLTDIPGFVIPDHGNLSHWANQGVLMLNATLTVEKDKAGSHQGKGWEQFTDAVIRLLAEQKENLVFILWGKFAQGKTTVIDPHKHLILQAAHPSPFSAYNGFFGCKHFSQTNRYLQSHGMEPIHW
jgi:uracil-DNA glycosylase